MLIFRRFLDVIEDEDFDGPRLRFQLEPELILQHWSDGAARATLIKA